MLDGSNRVNPLPAVCAGACLGAALGYLCLSRLGLQLLEQVDASLDRALAQLQQLETTAEKVGRAIDRGRRALHAIEHMADPVVDSQSDRISH